MPVPHQPPALWLFDLDNTLHDAAHASFPYINRSMTAYMASHLGLTETAADALRQDYWRRYGATLRGLVRHHDIDARDFLRETHVLPGLEARIRVRRADLAAVARLPGRKWVYTNGPEAYARRILRAAGIAHLFDGVIGVETARMFGQFRPKPDRRALRRLLARLKARPARTVLVDDSPLNLKSAARIGMGAVWMTGFMSAVAHSGRHGLPLGAQARISSLTQLVS